MYAFRVLHLRVGRHLSIDLFGILILLLTSDIRIRCTFEVETTFEGEKTLLEYGRRKRTRLGYVNYQKNR